jgi:SAM-dependent methyltransferase
MAGDLSGADPVGGHGVIDCYYHDAKPTWANAYLWPVRKSVITGHEFTQHRALDLGCGNGATANMLAQLGFEVGGHIKFFSIKTLRTLLEGVGFRHVMFLRAGRFPPLTSGRARSPSRATRPFWTNASAFSSAVHNRRSFAGGSLSLSVR